MRRIKKLKKQDKKNYLRYLVDDEPYRGYEIGNLPSKFGCIKWNKNEPIVPGSDVSDGIDRWLKIPGCDSGGHGGLILVSEEYFPKWV